MAKQMYKAKENSPITYITSAITAAQTSITVTDGSKLPDAPNIATLGFQEDAETILYAGKNGNTLQNVTRGFQGIAKSWSVNTPIARLFTAYDHDGFIDNIEESKRNLSNPNLLINSSFKIWQRGTSFTNPSNQYCADRWICNGIGTINKVTGGMRITGTINIKYIMHWSDFQKINNKTVTLSYSIDGAITKNTFVATGSVNANATVVDFTVTDKTINWIKLETGETATLFTPNTYSNELLNCQLYYESSGGSYLSLGGGNAFVPYRLGEVNIGTITYKTQKIITPTARIWRNGIADVVNVVSSSSTVTIISASTTMLVFSMSAVGSGQGGQVHANFNYEIDAEI